MTDKVVELIRRFTPLSPRTARWDLLAPASGRPVRWHEIEDAHRVLILADPGTGKTFEAQTRATRIRSRGKKAFFICQSAFNIAPRSASNIDPLVVDMDASARVAAAGRVCGGGARAGSLA